MIVATLLLAQLAVTSCREVTLEERDIFLGCDNTKMTGTYRECSYGSKVVTDEVNRLVATYVRKSLARFEAESSDSCEGTNLITHSVDVSCSQPHVRGPLMSVRCKTYTMTGAHPEAESHAINLLIRDTHVCDADLQDLLNSPEQLPALWDVIRNELEEARIGCDIPDWDDGWIAEQVTNVESITFGPEFMHVTYDHGYFGYCMMNVDVPYVALRAILRSELLPHSAHAH